jgi:hypothetical protein
LKPHILRHRVLLPALAGLALASGSHLSRHADNGHRWASSKVPYYVNPQRIHVSAAAATGAMQQAAAGWSEQSNASIELVYAGTTNGSSFTLNNRNKVFFRNGSNGGNVFLLPAFAKTSDALLN